MQLVFHLKCWRPRNRAASQDIKKNQPRSVLLQLIKQSTKMMASQTRFCVPCPNQLR